MGTGLVENGHLSARDVAFQEERARAGVGLIVTGAAVVHPTSLFPVRIIVEAWDEDGIDALRARVDAVQRHGARIFGQLVHLGRESPGGLTNSVPMAPSAVASPRDPSPPHEMSVAEVRMIVDAFAVSAANFQAGRVRRRRDLRRPRLPRRAVPLVGVEPPDGRLPRRYARRQDAAAARDRRGHA